MTDFEKVVPKKFWRGKTPIARNVGDLKKLLAELPDDLPLTHREDLVVGVAVYNIREETVHLDIVSSTEDFFR